MCLSIGTPKIIYFLFVPIIMHIQVYLWPCCMVFGILFVTDYGMFAE